MTTVKDPYQKSRVLYIIEAALEYFIDLMISEAYLAKVATASGLPDSLTNILSSMVSLACTCQLFAVFLTNKTPVKRWITPLYIVNQLLFALLYVIPEIQVRSEVKMILFIFFLLAGHGIAKVIWAPKIYWFMALVDDQKRGRFTANKEIVSLISGMIFTFVMGQVIDNLEAKGNLSGAFAVIAVTIVVLMLMHTATLVFSKEKSVDHDPIPVRESINRLRHDRTLFLVLLVSIWWTVSAYVTTPFYGTYRNNVLGFSMTFNAIISILYSIIRALVSRPLGKLADKYSFATMLSVSFCFEAVALAVNTFTVPENGHVLFTIYYILHGIALAGASSSSINLVYDYVKPDMRTGALAIRGALVGLAGFVANLIMAIPVDYINRNGYKFLGLSMYGQQFASAVGFLLVVGLIIYINTIVKRLKTTRDK